EFGLLLTLVPAATAIEGLGSPQTALGYRRMLELARELGDDEALSTALRGIWVDHLMAARHQEAAELVGQMLKVAEHRNSPTALADALTCQAGTLNLTGHYGDAMTALNRAIEVCPDGAGRFSFNGIDPLAESLTYAAQSTWAAGCPESALSIIESTVKRTRDLNQPFSMANALYFAIVI